jgi:hypothetical protein
MARISFQPRQWPLAPLNRLPRQGQLKLTINAEKTRICKVPEGEFDFLGFTFGRTNSPRTGQAHLAYGHPQQEASPH